MVSWNYVQHFWQRVGFDNYPISFQTLSWTLVDGRPSQGMFELLNHLEGESLNHVNGTE